MSMELYYFSGTGNSLFVARELQKRLPGATLIPIVSLLNEEDIEANSECAGIIFPVHAITIPIPVRKFLRKLKLDSVEYIFAVATRGGTIFKGFETADSLLAQKGRQLDAHFILIMYMNDPREAGYKGPTGEEIAKLEASVLKQLDAIKDIVEGRQKSLEKDTEYLIDFSENRFLGSMLARLVVSGMALSEHIGGVNYFCADSSCTGCGVCERVCLSRKIRMVGKHPEWQKNVLCYMCYACVNYCPVRAAQINSIPVVKSHTRENGRYTHPYATVQDIYDQKCFIYDK